MNSPNSPNVLQTGNAILTEATDGIGGVDINKDLLYGEYLNQERNTLKINNEIKRKAVHKALDLPMDDPMNITSNTTHNYPPPSPATDSIKQLEQTLAGLLTNRQPTSNSLGVPTAPSLVGSVVKYGAIAALGALVPGGFLLGPVVAKVADQILNPSSISIPQEAKQPLTPTAEINELKAYIETLKNRKYVVRHFDKNGNEIYIQPLPESLSHDNANK